MTAPTAADYALHQAQENAKQLERVLVRLEALEEKLRELEVRLGTAAR